MAEQEPINATLVTTTPPQKASAVKFVVSIGIVSLFADMTCTGPHAVTPGPIWAFPEHAQVRYGLFWVLGGTLIGLLYDFSVSAFSVLSVVSERKRF
jgi:hypothetical protein